mgnify:CR=1 FL=1
MINLSLTTAQEQALDIDKHTLVEAGAGAGVLSLLVRSGVGGREGHAGLLQVHSPSRSPLVACSA